MIPQNKVEEILEAVWVAEEHGEQEEASVRSICPDEIVAGDLQALQAEGLVTLQQGRVLLTDGGRKRARGVIRRHRLTEVLLTTVLGMPAARAHEIACEMEHTLVPEMTQSICTLLGHPEVSPDGKPIPPGPDCLQRQSSVQSVLVRLTELQPGQEGRVAYIKPSDHERGHQLAAFGLSPGVTLRLHQKHPAYCVRYEGTELALDEAVARDIYVTRPA